MKKKPLVGFAVKIFHTDHVFSDEVETKLIEDINKSLDKIQFGNMIRDQFQKDGIRGVKVEVGDDTL
jgi:hypothetical protein